MFRNQSVVCRLRLNCNSFLQENKDRDGPYGCLVHFQYYFIYVPYCQYLSKRKQWSNNGLGKEDNRVISHQFLLWCVTNTSNCELQNRNKSYKQRVKLNTNTGLLCWQEAFPSSESSRTSLSTPWHSFSHYGLVFLMFRVEGRTDSSIHDVFVQIISWYFQALQTSVSWNQVFTRRLMLVITCFWVIK